VPGATWWTVPLLTDAALPAGADPADAACGFAADWAATYRHGDLKARARLCRCAYQSWRFGDPIAEPWTSSTRLPTKHDVATRVAPIAVHGRRPAASADGGIVVRRSRPGKNWPMVTSSAASDRTRNTTWWTWSVPGGNRSTRCTDQKTG